MLTDGSEPNTASFVAAYMQGACEVAARPGRGPGRPTRRQAWTCGRAPGSTPATSAATSWCPGSIAVVMTIIGALLTSLVVAREWERGTMEALLATPVTAAELLLSKILPYYLLGMVAMALCPVVSVLLMGVPFRGSLAGPLRDPDPVPGQRPGLGPVPVHRAAQPVQRRPGRAHRRPSCRP